MMAFKPYTQTTKTDSVNCVYLFIYIYICNNNNQKEGGHQSETGRVGGLQGADLRGAGGRKGKGESDTILF